MALSIFSIVLKHLNSIHVLCVSYGSCFTHTLHALLLLSEGRKPCRCRWQKLSPRCGSWTSTLDTCSRGRPGHLLDSGTYAGHHTSLYPHNGGCQILKTCSGDTEAGEGAGEGGGLRIVYIKRKECLKFLSQFGTFSHGNFWKAICDR